MPSVETAASKAAASADELQAKESIRVAAAAARASAASGKLGYAAPIKALPPVRGDVQPTGGFLIEGLDRRLFCGPSKPARMHNALRLFLQNLVGVVVFMSP